MARRYCVLLMPALPSGAAVALRSAQLTSVAAHEPERAYSLSCALCYSQLFRFTVSDTMRTRWLLRLLVASPKGSGAFA